MYCGDETGAFVGEVGYSSARFGYGGEDTPKVVVPSHARRDGSIPTSSLRGPNLKEGEDDLTPVFDFLRTDDPTDPNSYLSRDGVISNFDAWEACWLRAFDELRVRDSLKHSRGGGSLQPAKHLKAAVASSTLSSQRGAEGLTETLLHPILAVDAGNAHSGQPPASAGEGSAADDAVVRQQRSQMLQIFFESFGAPAAFVAPSPMMSAFSHGRQTALVLDVGGGGCRATPVVDGLLLKNAQRRCGRGGEWLSAVQRRALHDLFGEVHPHYAVRHFGKSNSGPRSGALDPASLSSPAAPSTREPHGKKRPLPSPDAPPLLYDVEYPPHLSPRKTRESLYYHDWAVRELMYEIKTGRHIHLKDHRTDWAVPFLYAAPTKSASAASPADSASETKQDGADPASSPGKTDVAAATSTATTATTSSSATTGRENDFDDDDDEEYPDEGTGPPKFCELPDGNKIDLLKSQVGRDSCRLPELFFSDEDPYSAAVQSPLQDRTLCNLPLHKLVRSALTAVGDVDVRKELCGNIILSGSSSLFPNLEQRLSVELSNLITSAYKCRVVASRNTVERKYAAWIGGSILTSLGSFQQLWLSKAEYEEYGAVLGLQRFP